MSPVPPKGVQQAAARAADFRRGGEGYPSPGRVARDAWGGDPVERWARRKTRD